MVADAARALGRWGTIGFCDDAYAVAGRTGGWDVVGGTRDFFAKWPPEVDRIVAVGHNRARFDLVARAVRSGVELTSLSHPRAIVAADAVLGFGAFVAVGAVVESATVVGAGGIVNSGCHVGYGSVLGDAAHLSPSACLGRRVRVGLGAWVGAGSIVEGRVDIGRWAVVGAGSVVSAPVGDNTVVVGRPARVLRVIDAEY